MDIDKQIARKKAQLERARAAEEKAHQRMSAAMDIWYPLMLNTVARQIELKELKAQKEASVADVSGPSRARQEARYIRTARNRPGPA